MTTYPLPIYDPETDAEYTVWFSHQLPSGDGYHEPRTDEDVLFEGVTTPDGGMVTQPIWDWAMDQWLHRRQDAFDLIADGMDARAAA